VLRILNVALGFYEFLRGHVPVGMMINLHSFIPYKGLRANSREPISQSGSSSSHCQPQPEHILALHSADSQCFLPIMSRLQPVHVSIAI
jgi:hypothetical protein